jgi:hypothetical protein
MSIFLENSDNSDRNVEKIGVTQSGGHGLLEYFSIDLFVGEGGCKRHRIHVVELLATV